MFTNLKIKIITGTLVVLVMFGLAIPSSQAKEVGEVEELVGLLVKLDVIEGQNVLAALTAAKDADKKDAIAKAGNPFCGPFTRDLTLGSSGKDVLLLQSALELDGFLVFPAGVARGYFGNLTRTALVTWQRVNGIFASGFLDRFTRELFAVRCTGDEQPESDIEVELIDVDAIKHSFGDLPISDSAEFIFDIDVTALNADILIPEYATSSTGGKPPVGYEFADITPPDVAIVITGPDNASDGYFEVKEGHTERFSIHFQTSTVIQTGIYRIILNTLTYKIEGEDLFRVESLAQDVFRSEALFLTNREVAVDFCPNIAGIQTTVPAGYIVNSAGNCVPVVVDFCPNIAGQQTAVPVGYMQDINGNCVPLSVDICPNISGHQTTVPTGYVQDANGNCLDLIVSTKYISKTTDAKGNVTSKYKISTNKVTEAERTKWSMGFVCNAKVSLKLQSDGSDIVDRCNTNFDSTYDGHSVEEVAFIKTPKGVLIDAVVSLGLYNDEGRIITDDTETIKQVSAVRGAYSNDIKLSKTVKSVLDILSKF